MFLHRDRAQVVQVEGPVSPDLEREKAGREGVSGGDRPQIRVVDGEG
jgi:hypothetical protein